MEAFQLLSGMQNLPQTLFEDKETQAKLKQFWTVLDDLAESNPLEYAKFIEQNLQSGLEEAKKTEESSQERIRVRPSYCLKTVTSDGKRVCVNILHSEKVLGPLRRDRSLADPLDMDTWTHIPVSFSPVAEKQTNKPRKKTVVDAVINTAVHLQAARDLRVKSQVLGHVVMRLERKLKEKLLFAAGNFSWAKKEYVGGTPPESHTLEPQASPKDYLRFMEVVKQKSAQVTPEVTLTANQPPDPPQAPKVQPVAPVLIQEIQRFAYKSTPAGKVRPPVSVFEEKTHFFLEVTLTSCSEMREISLDVSQSALRLAAPPNFALDMDFSAKIDADSTKAKWAKRKKTLSVTLLKIE